MFGLSVPWLRQRWPFAGHAAVCRCDVRVTPACLFESLPALGNVLYMPMAAKPARDMPVGMLVESPSLLPLLQTCRLVAASTITVEGPREWIECVDRKHHRLACLHLLPDTDYFAWDALLECARTMTAAKPAHGVGHVRPASARVLRFHLRGLAGLRVLGADDVVPVSPLSRRLAGQIARAEAVPLQLAIDG